MRWWGLNKIWSHDVGGLFAEVAVAPRQRSSPSSPDLFPAPPNGIQRIFSVAIAPSVFFVLSCEAADYLNAIAASRAASIQAFISVLCPRFDETQETNERSKLIARAAG